jgi:hypothetical protein
VRPQDNPQVGQPRRYRGSVAQRLDAAGAPTPRCLRLALRPCRSSHLAQPRSMPGGVAGSPDSRLATMSLNCEKSQASSSSIACDCALVSVSAWREISSAPRSASARISPARPCELSRCDAARSTAVANSGSSVTWIRGCEVGTVAVYHQDHHRSVGHALPRLRRRYASLRPPPRSSPRPQSHCSTRRSG